MRQRSLPVRGGVLTLRESINSLTKGKPLIAFHVVSDDGKPVLLDEEDFGRLTKQYEELCREMQEKLTNDSS